MLKSKFEEKRLIDVTDTAIKYVTEPNDEHPGCFVMLDDSPKVIKKRLVGPLRYCLTKN